VTVEGETPNARAMSLMVTMLMRFGTMKSKRYRNYLWKEKRYARKQLRIDVQTFAL